MLDGVWFSRFVFFSGILLSVFELGPHCTFLAIIFWDLVFGFPCSGQHPIIQSCFCSPCPGFGIQFLMTVGFSQTSKSSFIKPGVGFRSSGHLPPATRLWPVWGLISGSHLK